MKSPQRAAAFRHDGIVSGLAVRAEAESVHWEHEPTLCDYRKLVHVMADAKIPVPLCATPVAVTGVGVVVATFDGRIRLLSTHLEREYWQRRLASAIYAPLVVDHTRRHIIAATTHGEVASFDLRGNVAWLARTDASYYARPLVLPDADVVVLVSFGSRCLGLELATGAIIFDRPLPRPWADGLAQRAAYRDPYASPSATPDEVVILCCAEHVLALAPDGRLIWEQEIGHAVRSSPVVIDTTNELAVCAVDGRCRFLEVTTGKEIASVMLGGKVVASPAVSLGIVAVGCTTDIMIGIDAPTHTVRWRAKGAPRDHTSVAVLPNGDFVATTTPGNAVARRRDDGAFLWETSQLLGLSEHDPAMDVTPIIAADGAMYCGSYSGFLYRFGFRPASRASS